MSQRNPPLLAVPGFQWLGLNIGIKDDTLDFGVVASERECTAAAVFTRNNFPGAPVIVGRELIADATMTLVHGERPDDLAPAQPEENSARPGHQ